MQPLVAAGCLYRNPLVHRRDRRDEQRSTVHMIRSNGQKSLPAIGFLTVTRDVEQGLFGGYLVLNALGRPLEFHCTAPVRPNRAQEILYGPTLEPYLFGERIGQTLLTRSKAGPSVVFTDQEPAMAARQWVGMPLVLVVAQQSDRRPATSAVDGSGWDIATPIGARMPFGGAAQPGQSVSRLRASTLIPFELGGYQLAVDVNYEEDRELVGQWWPRFAEQIELGEPFGRIREAIDEARANLK